VRAAITGVLVVAVAFLLLVFVPDWILNLSGKDRSTKVLYATVEFAVALVGILYGLRRLQQRRLL
jgi:multisubunit Na+/H+ antiporter MnhB subunit